MSKLKSRSNSKLKRAIIKIRSKSENATSDSRKRLGYNNITQDVKSQLINNKVIRYTSSKIKADPRIQRDPKSTISKTESIGKKLFKKIKSTDKNIIHESKKMFTIFKYLSQNKIIVNEESTNEIVETITIFDFPFLKSYSLLFSNVVYYIKERSIKGKESDTDGLRFLLNNLGAKEAMLKSMANIYIYHNRKKLSNNSIDFLYSNDILLIINQILKDDVSKSRKTKPLSIKKLLSLNKNLDN